MPHLRTSMPILRGRSAESRIVQGRLDKLTIQIGKSATNEQIRNILDSVHKQNVSVKSLTANNEKLKERHAELAKDVQKLRDEYTREHVDLKNGLVRLDTRVTSDKTGIWRELNKLDKRKVDSGRVRCVFNHMATDMELLKRHQRLPSQYYSWHPNDSYEVLVNMCQ